MNQRVYFVYIITNKSNSVLYTGVTNNIEARIYEHKNGIGSAFTKKYRCKKLIYFEEFDWIKKAIHREKEIKGWTRKKKEALVNKKNALWLDLTLNWYD